jgi:hypothetical protein
MALTEGSWLFNCLQQIDALKRTGITMLNNAAVTMCHGSRNLAHFFRSQVSISEHLTKVTRCE